MREKNKKLFSGGGLGIAAVAYIGVDYLRHISPKWHETLQQTLWALLAIVAATRALFYKHWSKEFRMALPFIGSFLLMLVCLLFESVCVRFVTSVLGLDWHRETHPLPDTGQWLLLGLNETLPQTVVEILRARIVGLHHYLMLFVMLAFSVLFDSVKAPGLGLGARYMFTMAIGRLLRAITFASTILPSPRPWCANARYEIPSYPHRWAQKYYSPYASDPKAIRQLLHLDMAYETRGLTEDPRPEWGSMNFLINFMRPNVHDTWWFDLIKLAGGGCNDLLYSGHMLVAVLTAMAWTEAYGGYSSALIWALVLHSAQREIRERHHYSVDCVVAIYVGVLLWKMTGFFWRTKDVARFKRLDKLEKIQSKLIQAAKDSDIEEVRELLKGIEVGNLERQDSNSNSNSKSMWLFSGFTILGALVIVFFAFKYTTDG